VGDSIYPSSAPELPDDFWEELAEENPLGSSTITAQDAADWFYLRVWCRYKAQPYGRSELLKQHIRMVTLWWSNLEGFEIIEARHLRRVKLGLSKPKMHRTRRGSREMPQETRHPAQRGPEIKENSLSAILGVVGGEGNRR